METPEITHKGIEELPPAETHEEIMETRPPRKGKIIAIAQEIIDSCFVDFVGGKSITQIAFERNLSANTIRSWSARYLWAPRKNKIITEKKAQEAAEKSLSSGVTKRGAPTGKAVGRDESSEESTSCSVPFDPTPYIGMDLAALAEEYTHETGIMAMRFLHVVKHLPDSFLLANASKIKNFDEINRKALGLEDKKPTQIINIGMLAGGPPPLMPVEGREVVTLEAEEVPALSDSGQNLSDGEESPSESVRVGDPEPEA